MIEIGRLCVKLAGRDAGKTCVVVDIVDKNTVLIDGQTRRRKCNLLHLEPLKETVDVKKGASHDEVAKAFSALKLEVFSPKTKEKKSERPRRKRTIKVKSEKKPKKTVKKKVEKVETKVEVKKPELEKPLTA